MPVYCPAPCGVPRMPTATRGRQGGFRLPRMLRRELPPGVVDGVGRIEDQLADGHNGVAVVDKTVEDGGQRLRRVQRGVVEQHDAPRLHLGRHPLAYRLRVVVLPVQRVPIGNDLKPLRRKGLQVWQLCALAEKLTCKWGVWRTFQARERSNSRGRARGGRWLKDGGGCGILISSQRTFCIRLFLWRWERTACAPTTRQTSLKR